MKQFFQSGSLNDVAFENINLSTFYLSFFLETITRRSVVVLNEVCHIAAVKTSTIRLFVPLSSEYSAILSFKAISTKGANDNHEFL